MTWYYPSSSSLHKIWPSSSENKSLALFHADLISQRILDWRNYDDDGDDIVLLVSSMMFAENMTQIHG